MMSIVMGNPQPTLFSCVRISIIRIRIYLSDTSFLINDLTNCRKEEKEEVKRREVNRKDGGQEMKTIVIRDV